VKTSDGYFLRLYRISAGKGQTGLFKKDPQKKVVLLQHGLVDSSDSWVANFEEKALPFILANKGYDVWLGNNRGNKYSRDHESLNPNTDAKFWQFSLHEMGTLDLPAIIEYILKATGRNKISYIGHSQGTAQLFAAASLDPDYFSQRINCFLAFGPVTNLKNIGTGLLKVLAKTRLDDILSRFSTFDEFLPTKKASENLKNFVCGKLGLLCEGILSMLADANPKDDDLSRFLVFVSHFPSGTSLRTVHHFADNIRYDRFSQLDDNHTPYDLSKIKNLPISLFVGQNDLLATVSDNRVLKEILEKSNVLNFYKEYENMGHATFFLSKTNQHVNDAIPILEKFSSQN
jgi:pimeloyl-ACP methyl ester carboxylesterase